MNGLPMPYRPRTGQSRLGATSRRRLLAALGVTGAATFTAPIGGGSAAASTLSATRVTSTPKATTTGAAGVSTMNNAFTTTGTERDNSRGHVSVRATTGHVVLGGNVFSELESGYSSRTAAAAGSLDTSMRLT